MTYFALLSPEIKLLLCALVFIACAAELYLSIYKFIRKPGVPVLIRDMLFIIFLILILALLSYYSDPSYKGGGARFPWIAVPLSTLALFIHSGYGIAKEYHRGRNEIGPNSIKEAIDNLKTGIYFADRDGKSVLVNYSFINTYYPYIQGYPGKIDDIMSVIEKRRELGNGKEGVRLYRLDDDRVYKTEIRTLDKPGLEGYTQMMTQDVTDIYEANETIEKENEELKVTNRKMQKMYDRLSVRIREQETLNLKMRIHNDIGSSLIAISDLLSSGEGKSVDENIAVLSNAIGYFSGDRAYSKDTLDEIMESGKLMNVSIEKDGDIPEDGTVRKILSSLIEEAVTNTIKHAGGDRIYLKIRKNLGIYTVTCENSGKIPDGEITEGGGLSSLRQKIEEAGGEMNIATSPRFAIILNIGGKEDENV